MKDAERRLYLAVTDITFENTLQLPIVQPALQSNPVSLIVFRPSEERIVRWITQTDTAAS